MFAKYYRLFKSYLYKLLRAQATPHKIALAVAIGFFVACFIPVGLHTVTVILLAFIFRVDKIIAFAATWLANPYTLPIMYPYFCFIGSKVIRAGLTLKHINNELKNIIHNFHWHEVMVLGKELLFSWFVGGFLCGIVIAIIGYIISYVLVKKFQEKRILKRNSCFYV